MATTEPTDELEVRRAIREERQRLAESLDELRGELGTGPLKQGLEERLQAVFPVAAAGALGAGFVLAGGIGATVRLLLRRGREGRVKAQAGRFALVDRR